VDWPLDRLTALRRGQRLVAEVPASGPGRRAFVDVTPRPTAGFRLEHWEYDVGRMDGFDYDIGAVLLRTASVTGEAELADTIRAWQLEPDHFTYPWRTDDPR
jgi:hypothetical protein